MALYGGKENERPGDTAYIYIYINLCMTMEKKEREEGTEEELEEMRVIRHLIKRIGRN